MAKTNTLDIIHTQTQNLRVVCTELADLRKAFELTGNTNLADHLDYIAEMVYNAQEKITKGYHKEINDSVNATNKAFGDTIAALKKD